MVDCPGRCNLPDAGKAGRRGDIGQKARILRMNLSLGVGWRLNFGVAVVAGGSKRREIG